jgi:hypothetical protein
MLFVYFIHGRNFKFALITAEFRAAITLLIVYLETVFNTEFVEMYMTCVHKISLA